MSAPLVSVLVPVFERASLLRASVESALLQTVSDLEVVIVDNASQDGTWEVCQELAADDSRVRIFRNPTNIGPVRNWARCIDECHGTYAKFLYSDDLIAPTFLTETLPFLTGNSDVGLAWTQAEIGAAPGDGRLAYAWNRPTGTYSRGAFLAATLFGSDVPVSPSAALFRRSALARNLCIQPVGPVDWSSHGAGPDWLLYLLTAAQHRAVGYVAQPITFLRHHAESITVARRGDVNEGYEQAVLWFAATQLSSWWQARVRARSWWRAVVSPRRSLTPRRHFARYDAGPPGSLFWPAAVVEGTRGLFRRGSRRLAARAGARVAPVGQAPSPP